MPHLDEATGIGTRRSVASDKLERQRMVDRRSLPYLRERARDELRSEIEYGKQRGRAADPARLSGGVDRFAMMLGPQVVVP